ncbi:glycosyltransferase [Pedobacter sp. AW1-32]|uniref:glycosyltransferase n=1 Tax=Pedobacter sp. AW1-32 TaxID=3383026 RepID=UPI003FF0067C
MSKQKLLIIGLVWPEPTSSAAGTRMVQLIKLFLAYEFEITFACAASKSDFSFNLEELGVNEQAILLNDSSFDAFLNEQKPNYVLFDRFMIEEQYGWRIKQECPDAMCMLDTEDLHLLRQARQESSKKKLATNLFSEIAKREIASILRCDLSLIISESEMEILKKDFRMDASLIYYLPFLENSITEDVVKNWLPFEKRKDCVFIGNFLHEPNWNTVQFLKTQIWPELRKKLPGVNLNIYGSYPSQKVFQLQNRDERFFIHGRAEDARTTIGKHRLLLAPIQFGAGVKGKFIDAMQTGTPSVTTQVGAEAMKGKLPWNGQIQDEPEKFILAAAHLYSTPKEWQEAQKNGIHIINQRYRIDRYGIDFIAEVLKIEGRLNKHRQHNFIGQILSHQMLQSTKYMSLWIEEKNKHKK